MKKIMFNDKYGLTQAVFDGRKTMTRRKDEQFKEYLSKKMKDYENSIQENAVIGSIADTILCTVRLNTIKDIISELFKED